MSTKTKSVLIIGLAVFTVLLCIGAATAKVCADNGGHWRVLWCDSGK